MSDLFYTVAKNPRTARAADRFWGKKGVGVGRLKGGWGNWDILLHLVR